MIKNIKEKLIYLTLTIFCCMGVVAISCPGIVKGTECVCEDPTNIWYKVSTFQEDKGKVIKLDMRTGQSFSDHQYIYLVVKTIDTGEITYIAFPNGGDWIAPTPKDAFLDALDEEFKNLEEYLRSQQGIEIKKKQ